MNETDSQSRDQEDDITLEVIKRRWMNVSPILNNCIMLQRKYEWSDEKTTLICLDLMLGVADGLQKQLHKQLAERPAPVVVIRKG